MTYTPQILGFGAISIDELVYVDQSLSAEKGKVINRTLAHGGNIATALVAAANLGARSSFIGWLNDQPEHNVCIEELHKHNVDTSFAPISSSAKPIRSTIIVDHHGERFIAYDDSVLHGTSETHIEKALQQSQVLMIDSYAESSLDIVARARSFGLQIVADIEWSRGATTLKLMDLSDHLVIPWSFAKNITGKDHAADILSTLWKDDRKSVVLTKGHEGAYVLENRGTSAWHVPTAQVDVVDTTGAGDCFHGAYAFALTLGKSALECTQYASAAAAYSVTGHGGRGALPTHQMCTSLLASTTSPRPISLN